MALSFYREPAPTWALPRLQLPLALGVAPAAAAVTICSSRNPWAARGQPASPWPSPPAQGNLFWAPATPPRAPSPLAGGPQRCSSRSSLWLLLCSSFPPLSHVAPEALPAWLMGSAVASSRSVSALPLTGLGGSFWHLLLPSRCCSSPVPRRARTSRRAGEGTKFSRRALLFRKACWPFLSAVLVSRGSQASSKFVPVAFHVQPSSWDLVLFFASASSKADGTLTLRKSSGSRHCSRLLNVPSFKDLSRTSK